MSRRTKRIILVIAFGQIVLIVGLLALPKVVMAIPGRYRVALSERSPFLSNIYEGLINEVVPMSTALPAPASGSDRPRITIPAINVVSTPEPTPAALADSSLQPLPTAVASVPAGETPTPVATPTNTPSPTPSPSPTPLPRQVKLEGIERIQQSFNNCGPANLTQVLNWYGDPTTQADAASYLKPNPEDRNVSPWQLSDYVNDFTQLKSTVHSNGTLEMLKRFIAAGFPVVIEKGYEPDTSGATGWFGHYLTVFGYDEDQQVFYSMDTYLKTDASGRADSYDTIDHYWREFNYTFYVVHRPDQEETVLSLLDPDLLDPLTMWQSAAERAQEDLEKDPEDAFAWFNLGTSLTRLGEMTGNAEFYQQGAAAFDEARTIGLPPRMLWYEFRPYLAYMKVSRYDDMLALADTVLESQGGRNVEETYLYQGHALLFEGDVQGAIAAYRRALELNDNFYPAEIALQSVGG